MSTQKTLFKLTLVQKVVKCLQDIEDEGLDISRTKTNDLIFSYYYRNGLSNLNRAHELHDMIDKGKLPTMESVSRAIRKARSLNPNWVKANKEDLIEDFANKVGYIDSNKQNLTLL